ncbi:MAG: PH domain-containing protein [Oscillospiraceae bacterium]
MKVYRPKISAFFASELVVVIVFAALFFAARYYVSVLPVAYGVVRLVLAAAYCALAFIYLPILFARTKCVVEDGRITSCFGAFINNEVVVEKSDIQYITLVKTPLSKITGLNFLLLNAFGGRVIIYFLSYKQASEIYREII